MSKPTRKCLRCPAPIYDENRTGLCRKCYREANAAVPQNALVDADRRLAAMTNDLSDLRRKYGQSLKTIERQERDLGWLARFEEGIADTYEIKAREGAGTSEGVAVVMASDWHLEEIVKPASVNGKNVFNTEVRDKRITRFWQSSLRLTRLWNQDVKINDVVIGLLGDFITGQIHGADNAETNSLLPIDAAIEAERHIASGIEFLLDNSKYTFTFVCKVGNHSRITLKVRHASETGHSLEKMIYAHLADRFRNEPRVKFIFEDGYHTLQDVFGVRLRWHHGHNIQYGGGIGGLFIPAYKAISQWNKSDPVDIDLFGHFHQRKDGGNFMCNGSLIGYNAYAKSIKADYEPPQQLMFLIDKRRGATSRWPILLDEPK